MNNLWHDTPESKDQTLRPELNPLTNPTLGRHLERWAQTYFTSSPETREQAVNDLLRELEDEDRHKQSQPSSPAQLSPERKTGNGSTQSLDSHAFGSQPLGKQPLGNHALLIPCPACHEGNEPSHNFCRACGSSLRPARAVEKLQPVAVSEPDPTGNEPMTFSRENDLEWLRGRALAGFEYQDATSSGVWRYLIIGAFLVLGGFFLLRWTLTARIPARSQSVTQSPAAPVQVAPVPAPQPTEPGASANRETETTETKSAAAPVSAAATNQSYLRNTSSFPSPSSAPIASSPVVPLEPGRQELSVAQTYLESAKGKRDPAEAAKWLWKAVGKQNMAASLLLADMYVHGDGVAKSCEQARVLLTAASAKGYSEATEKLRGLSSQTCSGT